MIDIIVCAVFLINIYKIYNQNDPRKIPGPRGLPFVGLGPDFAVLNSQGKCYFTSEIILILQKDIKCQ